MYVGSDHPPSIIKQILKSIAARLSSLSSSSKKKTVKTSQSYEQSLTSCGYNENITYVEQSVKNKNETKNAKETSCGLIHPIINP